MTAGTRKSLGRALLFCAAIVIACATLIPSSDPVTGGEGLCFICGDLGGVDALLNVALFVPLGVGAALSGFRASRAVPAMCVATLAIESLQFSVISGRDASVGDVLTNTLGGAVGFLIGAHIDRLARPSTRVATALTASWLCVWLAMQGVAGFALTPRPTESTYYGQIARALGGRPAYPGSVVAATVGGDSVPDVRFAQSRHAHDALAAREGAEIGVVVVPHDRTSQLLPIVRIADQEEREVVQVAADQADLVFGVRTGAAALRLRPVMLALHDAIPDDATRTHQSGRDTIRILARYGFRRITMSATVSGGSRLDAAVDLTLGKAWRLISPAPVYVDGSVWQSVLDALWVLVSLAPAGFWAAAATGPARGARFWPVSATLAIVPLIGLVLISWACRVAQPAPGELFGAMVGFLAGAWAGRRP